MATPLQQNLCCIAPSQILLSLSLSHKSNPMTATSNPHQSKPSSSHFPISSTKPCWRRPSLSTSCMHRHETDPNDDVRWGYHSQNKFSALAKEKDIDPFTRWSCWRKLQMKQRSDTITSTQKSLTVIEAVTKEKNET